MTHILIFSNMYVNYLLLLTKRNSTIKLFSLIDSFILGGLNMQKFDKEIELMTSEKNWLNKKVLTIVSVSQIFGGAGLAAGITVGALIAKDILGTDAYSGIPSALFTLGSAGAAMMVGILSQKYGRRIGLSIGFVLGGIGAIEL